MIRIDMFTIAIFLGALIMMLVAYDLLSGTRRRPVSLRFLDEILDLVSSD